MEYQYYDMFNFEKELANAISTIISTKEGEKLEFKMIDVATIGHIGRTFRPLDGGSYEYEIIPAYYYHFLVVATEEELDSIKKARFRELTDIQRKLKSVCRVSSKYDNVSFNPKILTEEFPYLESFFDSLNEWRAQTRRVTIDKDVIERCKNTVLNYTSKKLSK